MPREEFVGSYAFGELSCRRNPTLHVCFWRMWEHERNGVLNYGLFSQLHICHAWIMDGQWSHDRIILSHAC